MQGDTYLRAKATIGLPGGTVTIEGSEAFVSEQVARYSESPRGVGSGDASVGERPATSEREQVSQKQPKGHPEIVAVLAFSLAQEGIAEFDDEMIRRAYVRANIRPPKVVSQALRDAKNRFDYLEAGSKKGHFKLSHHGDRTVRFDLPREKKESK